MVPALAVADALRADGAEVVFVGGERAEQQLVPAAGYELHTLRVEPLPRRQPGARRPGGRGRRRGAARRPAADSQAAARRPSLGAGGYVAGPVGLAAVLARVPLVLMEADSHLGLTNRLLAPFARRVCLAFPIEGREGERYRVTGRPVPAPPPTGRWRAGAVRDRPRGDLRAGVRRQPGRPLDQPGGDRGVRRRALSRPARRRGARPARARVTGPALRPARLHLGLRPGARWPATWSWPARGARCSRSPPTAGRWC